MLKYEMKEKIKQINKTPHPSVQHKCKIKNDVIAAVSAYVPPTVL